MVWNFFWGRYWIYLPSSVQSSAQLSLYRNVIKMLPSLKTYHSLDTRACSPQTEPTKASWPGLLPSASGPSTWRDPSFYWTLCWCLNRKYSLTCFLECSPLQISKALSFLLMFPNHLLWLVPEGLHHPVHTCAHARTHTHTHTSAHTHTHSSLG